MIIQSFFGSAQTGLGYQFYDDSGTLLGSRITDGISTGPESGAYVADATIPAGAVGVYWDSDDAEASEDLREAIAAEAIQSKTDNLPATPAATGDIPAATAIRAEIDSNSTQLAAILADTGTSIPATLAALNDITVSEIRTELATELARLDAAVSTRLASASYDSPDSAAAIASQVRTELATELARIDAEISSRLAAAGYTAPDSAASIADAVWDEALSAHTSAGSTGEALDGAGGGGTAPTAAAIADAVWSEAIADHQSTGSTGEQLAAAGASGDPWATTVPASYADGTAGAAVGRLNNTPPAAPIVVLPDPSADSDLCVCYLDTETMTGTAVSGLEINIDLASDQPALSDQGKVVTSTRQAMVEDVDNAGRYILSLEKGLRYVAKNLTLFGVDGQSFSTASKSTLDIGSL